VTGTNCKRCVQYVPLFKWWAHQDLNLGPKDYEQLQEIKPITNHRVTSDLQRCGSKCGRASKITQLI